MGHSARHRRLAAIGMLLALLAAPAAVAHEVLFDSHAHLVTEDAAAYPRVPYVPPPAYRQAGVAGKPGGHAGPAPTHVTPDAASMLRWMREQHVEAIAAVQKRTLYGLDNRYILDSADSHRRRFVPVVGLDAQDPATPDVLRRLIAEHGVGGLRLAGAAAADGAAPWLNSPQALQAWAVAEQAGLVIDVEVLGRQGGAPLIPAVLELARAHPHVRVVLDHVFGLPLGRDLQIDPAFARLAGRPNIYFKFTTINLDILREAAVPAPAALKAVVAAFGADHVMWGSDVGTSDGTYEQMVGRMVAATAQLSAAQRRAVLYTTGRKVFVRGGTKP
jgi:predicted TIM-barrel fold metal-dependent hydrolase